MNDIIRSIENAQLKSEITEFRVGVINVVLSFHPEAFAT